MNEAQYLKAMDHQANMAAANPHPCALFRTHMPKFLTQYMSGIFTRHQMRDDGIGGIVRFVMRDKVKP